MKRAPDFWHNHFGMTPGNHVGASVHARAAAPGTVADELDAAAPRKRASELDAPAPRAIPHERGRSRLHFLGLILLGMALPLSSRAQEPAAVTFTLDFPGSEPSHYVISVNSDGRSTYDSDGKLSPDSEADPFHLDFAVSPGTSQAIFDLAKRAHYFDGEIDSNKRGLAFTGTKTLAYKDAQRTAKASYNYSPNTAVQQVTQLFQSLSATLEFGRRLQYFHRYQKLALDEELKRMEEMGKGGSLQELSAIVPILQRIALDSSVINPVRARAQRMIARAEAGKH